MQTKVLNYLALLALLSVQAFCYLGLFFGGRAWHGNISIDLGGVGLLIFVMSIRRYNAAIRYFVPIALWTAGCYIVFQNNFTSIAGALMIMTAVWLDVAITAKHQVEPTTSL